jgi:two-component system, NarL family, sensor kinase
MKYISISFLTISTVFASIQGNTQNIDSLLLVAKKLPADTHQVKATLGLAAAYLSAQPDSSAYWAKSAIDLAEKVPHGKKWLTNGWNSLGMAHYYSSNYRDAISAFEGFYKAAKAEKDLAKMGQAKNNQGNVWIELGRYDSTILLYKEALKIRQDAKDSFGIAMSYNNLGYIYKEVGNYDKAMENMLVARQYFEKLGNKDGVGNTLNNIGQVYLKKKEIDQAITYFKNGVALYASVGDERNMAISYHSIANAMSAKGLYDSARYYWKIAEEKYIRQKDERNLALINADLAESFNREEKWAEAEPYFQEAIRLNRVIENKRSLAGIYIAFSANNIAQNKLESGRLLLDSARSFLTISNQKNHWRDFYKTQAALYEKQGNPTLALQSLQQFVLYSDSVLNETNIKAIADMGVKYETEKKEQEIVLQKAQVAKKNIIIWAIAGFSALMALLGYSYYKRYRLKKEKELQDEVMRQQDEAARSVLKAEENERRRIAAELHDGVGQLMSAARMNLDAVVRELQPLETDKLLKLERVVSLVDEGCKEVRAVSHNMMPNALLKKGLGSALHDFIQKIDQQVIKTQLHVEGLQERLSPETESVLYRVIQECVNNVIKHSQANQLDISVIRDQDGIDVTIEDNGKGFDINEVSQGIGLQNIKARIQFLKGTLDIESSPGRGTFTGIHVPL